MFFFFFTRYVWLQINFGWKYLMTVPQYIQVNMADSGVLVCKGVNGFGSVSVQMNLIVKGKEGKACLKK